MDELEPQPSAPAEFDVTTNSGGDVIVTIRGELDITVVDLLQAEVGPLLERAPSRMVVDVSALRFADSSAIAMWVRWATAVPRFELHNPPELLRRVIGGMGLTSKLAVSP